MASLTHCLSKAGEALEASTRDAILARARELRAEGMSVDEANRQAVREHASDAVELAGAMEEATSKRPADEVVATRAVERLKDFATAVKRYAKRPDAEGGKVLNTDTARELMPDYLADRTRSAAVHEASSAFIKKLYAEKLKEEPKAGEMPMVLFTAGGTGAGKSSAIKNLARVSAIKRQAQIVYDTNMNTFDSAVTKIDQALEAGKAVQIVMVVRDPIDALVNGALTRAENQAKEFGTGRAVPIPEHVKTHTGVLETIPKLAEHYANDPRVEITVIDNTQGKGKQAERDLPWLDTIRYNDVEQQAKAALEREREAGRISAETYQGFAGSLDAGAAQATGRVPQERGAGVRGSAEEGDRAEVGSKTAALAQGDRGQISMADFGKQPSIIALLKNADLSTFLHESGHFFLEVYSDVASRGGQKAIADDVQSVMNWFGVRDLDAWRTLSFEQQRGFHEQFARGFEAYLLEGKAPSVEMRPMFARFRSWLLQVYRSVRALGAEITPEVRGVFDRMLASEDAIREAEAQRRYEPLFRSAADAGMTDKEFADYLAIGQQASDQALDTMQARSVRDMKWLSGAKSRALKDLQGKADSERKAIAEQVEQEVNADPAFSAAEMLRAHKGAEPELVAEMAGYQSADEMMQAIRDAGNRADVIQAMTDQRMLQLHGDLTDPKAIEDAANEAVHNEARARFVATGLKALTKSPLPARMIAAAAKAAAETAIARKRVRDLDPYAYLRAESRANKDALAAAAKKPAEAIEAQRAALLNNRLARASLDARAEVEKGVTYLKKAETAKIDPEYADQIGALLERFELGGTLKRADQMVALAKWVEAQKEIGIDPDIPDAILAEANRTNYRNLTVEEFRGLVDTVKQIEHLGRLKKKLLTAKDGREFAAARDDMLASIEANASGRVADVRSSNTVLGQSWERVKGFWASHIKAATWARIADGGKDGGVMWERIIRPANEAGDRETVMRAKATKDLMALVAPVLKEGGLGGKGKFFATIGRSLNREARLAWALNTGNEGNLQRLLDGNGITREQAQPVLDSLTASDWRFVQSVWDYFETYRPEIGAKERRITGKEPDWVEPVAQTVRTADGQTVELKGGYFPIKYDPRASARAEQFANAEDIAQQMQGAYTSATTRRSFTKTRAGEVKGRPLMESLDGIYGGIQEVIHDLAWHETLIDANRLLKDEQVAAMIRSTYGPEAHQQLKNWLQDVAVGEGAARKAGEDALAWVRQGVSVAGLGFNVMTALIQPLGLTQSMVRIGPQFVGRGLAKAMGSPIETTREISAMSDFMANRFLTRNRELNELRNTVKGQTKVRRAIDTTAYALMLRAQQLVDIPTWWGAYEKAMHEGNDSARSADLADQAVIDSQGSGMLKDQSAIERGGPALKLFTTFYAFFNTAFNVGAQRTMNAESKARLAADYLLLYTVPAILGAAMKDAITPGDSENWDDPDKLARKLVGEQLGYLFGLMFGLREIGSPMANMIKGEGFGTDYQGPAGLRLLGDALKAGKQIEQGEFDDALRKAVVNLAGDLLRLPSAQINRSVTGTQALIEGKTDNPAAVLFGYQEPH